jgi:hypothetical protein
MISLPYKFYIRISRGRLGTAVDRAHCDISRSYVLWLESMMMMMMSNNQREVTYVINKYLNHYAKRESHRDLRVYLYCQLLLRNF